jgi:ADP-ribose pyrophosphatase YjhB (NUDIX family)/ribosomal protein S18 acetylase RimI-like enzyme
MNETAKVLIRPITASDEPFLREVVYYAIYVPEGTPPPSQDVLNRPDVAKYVRAWGREGDRGFVAIDTQSQARVGATWFRLFNSQDRGYGYVDDSTPELTIAILPEYRGQGIGTRLLGQLLESAASHYRALSLSVDPDNPALRLYKRLGFEAVRISGSSMTMRKSLDRPWREKITPKVAINCVLLNDAGQVLLVKRKDNELWSLPGGFMDLGEQVRDAVLREVKEETGLAIKIVRMTGVYSHPHDSIYIHLGPQFQVVVLVFLGRILKGRFEDNPETGGFDFFSTDSLPPLVKSHTQRIKDALEDKPDVFVR